MRKLLVLVGISLSLALTSEALAAPNATVSDRVKAGEFIRIESRNCSHGPDYTAYVDITILRGDGTVAHESSAPADQENIDLVPAPDIGSYTVRVKCRHQFNATTSDTFWEETEAVLVTGLTAKERRKCRNIVDPKRERRCLKRQAAD